MIFTLLASSIRKSVPLYEMVEEGTTLGLKQDRENWVGEEEEQRGQKEARTGS